jgi:drug/metabolite transporter (DMT)-like permease
MTKGTRTKVAMTNIIIILIVAAIIESVGIAVLKGGLNEISGAREISIGEIARVIGNGATNGKILAGVGLEAVFFGCLLYMMSVRDVSFIWPLTSLGFIVTTLAAEFILHEKVTAPRWAGVLLIAIGALLTSYSEATKTQHPPAAPTTQSASLSPQ